MKKLNSSQPSHQLVPFIILILIAGLIMLNLWLYFWSQKEVSLSQPQTVVTTTDPLADWQTFYDSRLMFSFKYPNDWYKWIDGAENEASIYINHEPLNAPQFESFSIYIKEKSSLDTYDITRLNPTMKCIDKQNTKVREYETISYNCSSWMTPNTFKRYILANNNSIYDIRFNVSPNAPAVTYDQILSTFRFTDDMNDWQTYKSRNGQFEFNYPAFLTVKTASDVGQFPQLDGQSYQQYWDGVYIDYTNNYTDNPSGEDISLSIWPTNISADEFKRLYDSDGDPYSSIAGQKNITFNAHPAILIEADTAIGVPRYYMFPKAIPMVIEYYDATTTQRILSTFKFIK